MIVFFVVACALAAIVVTAWQTLSHGTYVTKSGVVRSISLPATTILPMVHCLFQTHPPMKWRWKLRAPCTVVGPTTHGILEKR